MTYKRRSVAIIGSGGAGMSAAWMLDPSFDVMLFERNQSLGGHAHTVNVEVNGKLHHVDDGFNWFSDQMYPRLLRLLELVGAATLPVPLSVSFYDTTTERSLVMPPVGLGPVMRVLMRPSRLRTLLQLNHAVKKAVQIVQRRDTSVTTSAFMDGLRLPPGFKRGFLGPFMSAVWGCPHDRMDECSIYPLMKYIVLHRPSALRYFVWKVVKGGANAYIRRVVDQLSATRIMLHAGVQSIARAERGWHIQDTQGRNHHADFVVVATGARDAHRIVRRSGNLERASAVLGRFEYYRAQVATHCDPSYMPKRRSDWAVANARYTGEEADMTIWDGWRTGCDVFDSYVRANEYPKDTRHVSSFWLPLVTPGFFDAQQKLRAIQGEGGLFFSGDYTNDIGSHEDALIGSMDVVRAIDPANTRLAMLQAAVDARVGSRTYDAPPCSPSPVRPQAASTRWW